MADFPNHVPTGREFQPGDWPVKRYTSQNGSEIRILRGNSRINATLQLNYDNIEDTKAQDFLAHYRSVQGTFQTWYLPAAAFGSVFTGAFEGWGGGSLDEFKVKEYGLAWRYTSAPQVTQVKKGRSNVRVSLQAVVA